MEVSAGFCFSVVSLINMAALVDNNVVKVASVFKELIENVMAMMEKQKEKWVNHQCWLLHLGMAPRFWNVVHVISWFDVSFCQSDPKDPELKLYLGQFVYKR